MAIYYRVLGEPGRDNALLVTVDSGQSQNRLLFDCGEECLSDVAIAHTQDVEALFFSHFHVDHIAGFDRFLRVNWCRPDTPVQIFGPPGSIDIMHHRLRGFTWNLVDGAPGEWRITEMDDDVRRTSRFFACEGFATRHNLMEVNHQATVHSGSTFHVEACSVDHGIECLAYVVREHDRTNVAADRLAEYGYAPGAWLKHVKDANVAPETEVDVHGTVLRVGQLREQLLTQTAGDSIAYLTDFYLETSEAEDRLADFLTGCQILVCENNYRNDDADLARKNYHMTSADVGRLASRVQPKKVVLFHLSDRYPSNEWPEQLKEVREHFEQVEFPAGWTDHSADDSVG